MGMQQTSFYSSIGPQPGEYAFRLSRLFSGRYHPSGYFLGTLEGGLGANSAELPFILESRV